jgi:hypothetical protein
VKAHAVPAEAILLQVEIFSEDFSVSPATAIRMRRTIQADLSPSGPGLLRRAICVEPLRPPGGPIERVGIDPG